MAITLERLRSLLEYDPESGVFLWKVTNSNRARKGTVAGRDNGNGYRRICVDRETNYAHRLAWFFFYGEWPTSEIDHKDGDPSNNRISNLRLATHAENGQNQTLRSTNTSGRHGVSWSKPHSKWAAYIWVGGSKKHLGLFESLDDAGSAYLDAKKSAHRFQPVPRDVNA